MKITASNGNKELGFSAEVIELLNQSDSPFRPTAPTPPEAAADAPTAPKGAKSQNNG